MSNRLAASAMQRATDASPRSARAVGARMLVRRYRSVHITESVLADKLHPFIDAQAYGVPAFLMDMGTCMAGADGEGAMRAWAAVQSRMPSAVSRRACISLSSSPGWAQTSSRPARPTACAIRQGSRWKRCSDTLWPSVRASERGQGRLLWLAELVGTSDGAATKDATEICADKADWPPSRPGGCSDLGGRRLAVEAQDLPGRGARGVPGCLGGETAAGGIGGPQRAPRRVAPRRWRSCTWAMAVSAGVAALLGPSSQGITGLRRPSSCAGSHRPAGSLARRYPSHITRLRDILARFH